MLWFVFTKPGQDLIKEYQGIREGGSEWSETERCLGFKLHVLTNAKYELPVAYNASRVSCSDITEGRALIGVLS